MPLIKEQLLEEAFLIGVPSEMNRSPLAILALTGVLYSQNGNLRMQIISFETGRNTELAFNYFQQFSISALIENTKTDEKLTLEAFGSPCQAYNYLLYRFEMQCLKQKTIILKL